MTKNEDLKIESEMLEVIFNIVKSKSTHNFKSKLCGDLTCERIDDNKFSIAWYDESGGSFICDPKMVFERIDKNSFNFVEMVYNRSPFYPRIVADVATENEVKYAVDYWKRWEVMLPNQGYEIVKNDNVRDV